MNPRLRSRKAELILRLIEELSEETDDYFDEELTGQLLIVSNLISQTRSRIREHELNRIRLARKISQSRGQVVSNPS